MAYARRRFAKKRTPRRKYVARRKTYRKKSKFSRRRQVTGIPLRKFLKVRKDVIYTIAGTTSSWNAIVAGGMQVANAAQLSYWTGNAVSAVDAIVDANGYSGMLQWFAFYNKYIVHGSKIKVTLLNLSADPTMVTLVPTLDYNLGAVGASGTTTFDNSAIDPGELPGAKRRVLNGAQEAGGSSVSLSSYASIKKMLAVKDLADVAWDDGAEFNSKPFVPQITSPTTAATSIQPNTGTGQNGCYWNIVLQNMFQNQVGIPGTPASPEVSMRIQITTYIEFSDRSVLPTTS